MGDDPMTYRARWRALWERVGGDGAGDEVLDDLIVAYSESQRAYHTLEHVLACLECFDTVRDFASHPDALEMALWFHDAVYNPRAGDNEARSAEWASDSLIAHGISADFARRVAGLILATRHEGVAPDVVPNDDAKLIADIDLTILGVATDVFDRYEEAIRREYAWLPDLIFRAGRRKVLRRFLARDLLYQTESFREKYELAARANLERSLQRLSGRKP